MKIGQKFGNLTVQKIIQNKAECKCSCGCIVLFYHTELESGNTINCGMCYLKKRGKIKRQGIRRNMYSPEYKKWRNAVYKRDKYKCVACGSGYRLNAHHLNSWDWAVQQRYDVENGRTLCHSCHDSFHFICGRGKNTREQFIFFLYTYYGKIL